MTDDLAIYTVIWRSHGESHLIDFDSRETACHHAEVLTTRGEADVFVSGPQTADVAKERIDAAARRTLDAIIAKLQEENMQLRMVAMEAGELAEKYRELEYLRDLKHVVPVEAQ